jgi:hypothetical protein
MSQFFVNQNVSGGDVTSITGNTGTPATGAVTLETENATPQFMSAGSAVVLNFGILNLVLGSSLPALTTGSGNSGYGDGVLNSLTSGNDNVAVGLDALQSATSASDNIAIGYLSLGFLLSGNTNIAIGFESLSTLTTGSENICIGANTNYTIENNNIIIGSGNNATVGDNAVIRIGNRTLITKCFIAGIQGVTVTSPVGLVNINALGQIGTIAASGFIQTINSIGPDGTGNFTLSGTANQVAVTGGTNSDTISLIGPYTPTTYAINGILYGNTTSSIQATAAVNNGVLITSNTGVPSLLANSATPGYVLTANSGASPSWQAASGSTAIETINGDTGSVSGTTVKISGGTTGLTTSGSATTLDLVGILALASGGTNANLTASNGGILYSTASAAAILAGTATANQVLLSGANTAPSWGSIATAGGITTIKGNDGTSETPSSGIFNIVTAGATVQFLGTSATETLNFAISNLILGTNPPSISSASNTAGFGTNCLLALTTGAQNCAFGYHSLHGTLTGGFNSAFGSQSLLVCTTAQNCAFGYLAGGTVTTATSCVFVGYESGNGPLTGVGNTFIGASTGTSYTGSEANNILIGNGVTGTISENNVTRLGNSSTAACYITGIDGVNVGSVAKVVTEASNQLGTATLTAGTGITITPTANTITISASSSGFTWNNTTGTSATLVAENGYFANNAGLVTYTLPSIITSNTGDTIIIIGLGGGGWKIAQLALEQIIVGSASSTVGITGSVASTNQYDTITLVYSPTSGLWRAQSWVGNLTVT